MAEMSAVRHAELPPTSQPRRRNKARRAKAKLTRTVLLLRLSDGSQHPYQQGSTRCVLAPKIENCRAPGAR